MIPQNISKKNSYPSQHLEKDLHFFHGAQIATISKFSNKIKMKNKIFALTLYNQIFSESLFFTSFKCDFVETHFVKT